MAYDTRQPAIVLCLVTLIVSLLVSTVQGQLGLSSLETQSLLSIKDALKPARINSGTILDTWDPNVDPCQPLPGTWIGVICNCSNAVVNLRYNPCPTGAAGDHVYGLDLSWRSIFLGRGWSKLSGWLSPMVANLTELKMLSLANNRIGGTFPDAALSTMVQLQAVDITGNMFNSTLPTFVGKLPILSQALMSRNNLQGSIPPEWCRRFASVDAEVPLVVIIADNPRVCGVQSSCLSALAEDGRNTSAFQVSYVSSTMIVFNNNFEGDLCCIATRPICPPPCYGIKAPSLWTPNATINFNFSNWLLEEEFRAIEQGTNITLSDLLYEFRIQSNTSAVSERQQTCSQFLGAYNPGKNLSQPTPGQLEGETFLPSFQVTQDPNDSNNNLATFSFGERDDQAQLEAGAYIIQMIVYNTKCPSRSSSNMSDPGTVVVAGPQPSAVFNTAQLNSNQPEQYNTSYAAVSFVPWNEVDGVPCCSYTAQVYMGTGASNSDPSTWQSLETVSNLIVIRNMTLNNYYAQYIESTLQVGFSYFVMVNGTNAAGYTTVSMAPSFLLVDPNSNSEQINIDLLLGLTLGIGLPVLASLLLFSWLLIRRLRKERRDQYRHQQQMQMLQDTLEAMTQQQEAFRGVSADAARGAVPVDDTLEDLKAVAIVVTDLEASTAAAKADPETYKEVQRSHDQSLRELLATYNGIEISTRGDSFTVVFFSASAAIKWAVAVQHRLLHTSWPKRVYALPSCGRVYTPDGVVSFAGPRVRMGIHWAEGGSFTCTSNPIGIQGPAYTFIDTLADSGTGGQVLLSESAWKRVRDVETCIAASFPIVRQLGLFQIVPNTPPEWVYEIRGQVSHPLLRTFHYADHEQPLRKITCVRPGRGLHVTYPPAPQALPQRNDKSLVFVSARIDLRAPQPSTVHTLTTAAMGFFRPLTACLPISFSSSGFPIFCGPKGGGGLTTSIRRNKKGPPQQQDSALTLGGYPATGNEGPGGAQVQRSMLSLMSGKRVALDGVLHGGPSTHQLITPRHSTPPHHPTDPTTLPHTSQKSLSTNTTVATPDEKSMGVTDRSTRGGASVRSRDTPRTTLGFARRSVRSMRGISTRRSSAASQETGHVSPSVSSAGGAGGSSDDEVEGRCRTDGRGMGHLLSAKEDGNITYDSIQDSVHYQPSFAWAIMRAADILVVGAMEFRGYAVSSTFQDGHMLFAFQHPLDAIHFCHLTQLALLFTRWKNFNALYPDLFGPEEYALDGRRLFAGPRVAMAVHLSSEYTSHATQAPQQLGSDILWPADVTYVGTGVQEAMAVSSALHGGQVAITQPVWGQLQGKVQANQQMLSLGVFAIPHYYDPQSDPQGTHLDKHLLVQMLPQSLAMRRFPHLRGRQLRKGYFDSPDPSQPLAICFVKVHTPKHVKAAMQGESTVVSPKAPNTQHTNSQQRSTESQRSTLVAYFESIMLVEALVRELLLLSDGYECKCPEPGKFTLAFSDLQRALEFCCALQVGCLSLEWPTEVLAWEGCGVALDPTTEQVVWRGLQVSCGVSWGLAAQRKPLNTGHADYFGTQANLAARLMASASPGQILVQHTNALCMLTHPLPHAIATLPRIQSLVNATAPVNASVERSTFSGGGGLEDGLTMWGKLSQALPSMSLSTSRSGGGGGGDGVIIMQPDPVHAEVGNGGAYGVGESQGVQQTLPSVAVLMAAQHSHDRMVGGSVTGVQGSQVSVPRRSGHSTASRVSGHSITTSTTTTAAQWEPIMYIGAGQATDATALWVQYMGPIHMKGLESEYQVVSVQPYRLFHRLTTFPKLATDTLPCEWTPLRSGTNTSSSSAPIHRKLSVWLSRPHGVDHRPPGGVMRGSLSSSSAGGLSVSGPNGLPAPGRGNGRAVHHHGLHVRGEEDAMDVPGGVLEDAHGGQAEVAHSTPSEVALVRLAHGVVLSDAQREQAMRLAKLYGDDVGLRERL